MELKHIFVITSSFFYVYFTSYTMRIAHVTQKLRFWEFLITYTSYGTNLIKGLQSKVFCTFLLPNDLR